MEFRYRHRLQLNSCKGESTVGRCYAGNRHRKGLKIRTRIREKGGGRAADGVNRYQAGGRCRMELLQIRCIWPHSPEGIDDHAAVASSSVETQTLTHGTGEGEGENIS